MPSEAAKAVAMLQAAYPGARWSEPTIRLYELMLADLDFEVARSAVERIIRTSRFLPTVAEILETAVEITVGPVRSGADAWGDVTMAIRRFGYIASPKFEDPIVADVVRIMSWRNLCLSETPEGVDRASFVKLYDERQRHQRLRDVSEPGRLLPSPSEPMPARVRELTEGLFQPVQNSHGKTGTENARRM